MRGGEGEKYNFGSSDFDFKVNNIPKIDDYLFVVPKNRTEGNNGDLWMDIDEAKRIGVRNIGKYIGQGGEGHPLHFKDGLANRYIIDVIDFVRKINGRKYVIRILNKQNNPGSNLDNLLSNIPQFN